MGDWIKLRAELYTHPRFLSLCSELIYNQDRPGLLVYICGAENLGIGVQPPSNVSVTERALRCVTERALRDVVMTALLRVWCAVNAHCKVVDDDAVMSPMTLSDLDELAGVVDFGNAMSDVGWVTENGPNTLIFPNFLEFNEPACLRRRPKSNAERQREFRTRKASKKSVTPRNESNDRGDKIRIDKNTLPPKGGSGTRKQKVRDMSDTEFLVYLQAQPVYKGISVEAEMAKATQWCEVRDLKLSRQRLINWLNKAIQTRPMDIRGKGNGTGRARDGRVLGAALADPKKYAYLEEPVGDTPEVPESGQ